MRKVALRGLLARKTRLALTALAVALGVTLIAGTYVFTDTINSSFDRIFAASYAQTDAVVTPDDEVTAAQFGQTESIPSSVADRIRTLPQVASVGGSVFDQEATILDRKGDPVSSGAPNFVASIQQDRRFESFDVLEGRLPRRADEVALDRSTAERKGFEVGGTVDIVAKEPRRTYRLVGLVGVAGVDSYGGAAVALMTLPEAQRITGKAGRFDEIAIAAKDGTSPSALRDAVRAAVPDRRYDVRTGQEEARDQTETIKDNLSFLPTALLAFAGISLFVGAFIIFNTFSITVTQRAREFALLRTLGASRGQVLRSVLTEGLALGALGSAVGLLLGIGVAKLLKALFYAVGFDLPSQGTVLETRTIVVSLVVGVLVTLLASLAPALRATRVPPVAALREGVALPESRSSRLAFPAAVVLTSIGIVLLVVALVAVDDATTGLSLAGAGAAATFLGVGLMSPKLVGPIAAVVGRVFGSGVTARLARENSVRQPGRTAATAAALMIGVALVSFASIFAASAKETVSGFIDRGLAGDAVIQHQNGFDPFSGAVADRVARVRGVETLSGFRFAQVRLDGEDEDVTGVDPRTVTRVYNVTSGGDVISGLGDSEVAVSRDFAKDRGLQAGDTLTVRTPRRSQLRLRVAGTFEDKADLLGDLVLPDATVARDVGVANDSYVFLRYAPGTDTAATKRAVARVLDRAFPQTEVLTASEFKDEQAGQIDQLLGMIYALLALAIIVSLFGIVNTLALSITERTRELGMLRAIGTSRRQVKAMIRKESVIIAVIGGVLGLAVGVVLSIVFTQAIDEIVLHVPGISLVLLLALSALAGVLAAALPARRAARLNVLEALAHE
ncbi:FtsX-like permease family protein [Conexibacter sp. W3-3-2]|uniref:ABC transporter permease n=1 Tax=Conexibacter sp. W3-3-2 TaxID=2675227 RepID=UPI0012B7F182|nr:FtsX-like permease family protein [Conexibacter sp. W3-3-2]MTD43498.1 FtsX-like permease family protein [Conexibacter sp. W3-3-2]